MPNVSFPSKSLPGAKHCERQDRSMTHTLGHTDLTCYMIILQVDRCDPTGLACMDVQVKASGFQVMNNILCIGPIFLFGARARCYAELKEHVQFLCNFRTEQVCLFTLLSAVANQLLLQAKLKRGEESRTNNSNWHVKNVRSMFNL